MAVSLCHPFCPGAGSGRGEAVFHPLVIDADDERLPGLLTQANDLVNMAEVRLVWVQRIAIDPGDFALQVDIWRRNRA